MKNRINNKMIGLSLNISIITLNVKERSGLSTPVKEHRLSG